MDQNLKYFIGAGGAPIIERAVAWILIQFKLKSFIAPFLVLGLAILEQFGLGFFLHFTSSQMLTDLVVTLLATFTAHEITTN